MNTIGAIGEMDVRPRPDEPISSLDLDDKDKTYEDIKILKLIMESKFSVYLGFSKSQGKKLAVKVFKHVDGNINPYFKSEDRMTKYTHPNIVRCYESVPASTKIFKGCSYIIMEYCPYGDFVELVEQGLISDDEKMVRTFFRQLIEGIAYLHSEGIYHLDLKLENLLLGKDLNLKITDFDSCIVKNEKFVISRGTPHFRDPDVRDRKCENYAAADIYSAAIILFTMRTGNLPYAEDMEVNGQNLFEMLLTESKDFWELHRDHDLSNDFKELFFSMTKRDPSKRATISQIKKSKWYQGPIYSYNELKLIFSEKFK